MTFARWPVLLLLFVPLALLIGIWRRDGRRVVLPIDDGRQSAGRFWQFGVNFMASFALLLMAVAILLLAGPRHLSVPKQERVLTNIEFCLDVSGSMGANFGTGTRHDAAIEAINQFVDSRPGDAFGLTLSSNIAVPWIPLTQDASAFKCAAPFVRPENMWRSMGGGTMLGVGMRKCQDQLLQRSEGDRMIILVSDGQSFDLSNGSEEKLARELRDNGIVVYYVHIGGGDAPAETSVVATITGGSTFAVDNQAALHDTFAQIDTMQKTKLMRTYAEVVDLHWPFCLAGFIVLPGAILSSLGMRYTPW